MNRGFSVAIIVGVWAAIYLPWLGTPELRSEEGHRVLPAIEMLESGDYIVPHIGGQPYLAKPPLVNWKIAAAFRLTGVRNEWTARLPSALHVLFAALVILLAGHSSLGRGSLVAALAWLTNLGLIEKGRMIEIDAIYVSFFAIAFVFWLVFWQRNGSRWLTWVVPWLFLGFGLLAKGPALLVFFYTLIIAVLWQTKRLRDLFQPLHLVGVLVMIAIFAAWAVPYFRAVHHQSISQTWTRELAMRITGGENDATDWPTNFPRGLAYFLPWLLVFPFVRPRQMRVAQQQKIARGLAWASVATFVVVLLLPGTIPRYVLPLLAPVCWLLGMAVRDNAFNWSLRLRGFSINVPPRLVWTLVTVGVLVAGIIFPLRSATFLKNRPKVKPIAAKVNAIVPPTETLYAVTPLFQPYLFYLHSPIKYVSTVDQLPSDARYFITGPTQRDKVDLTHAQLLLDTPEYRGHSTTLFLLKSR